MGFGEGQVGWSGLGSTQISLGKGSVVSSHPLAADAQPPAPLHGHRHLLSLTRRKQRGKPAPATFASSTMVPDPAPFCFAQSHYRV